MDNINNIDHGLNGGAFNAKTAAAANAYLRHKQMLSMMESADTPDVPAEDTDSTASPVQETQPATATPVQEVVQQVRAEPVRTCQKQPNDDQVIKIPNKNELFEVAYPDFESGLAVAIRARDINMDDDSLSILMDDSVSLKMPKWKPLYVKICDALAGEIIKKVVWGGGTHSFGKVKHLSFIIVTDDGKKS